MVVAQTRVREGKTDEDSVKRRAPFKNFARAGMRSGVTMSGRSPSKSTMRTRLAAMGVKMVLR